MGPCKEVPLAVFILMMMMMVFCSSCRGQNISPNDGHTLLLMNVIDTLDNLSLQLQAQEGKIKAMMEAQEGKIKAMMEAQEGKIKAMMEGQQQLERSIEQCSTTHQISQFQDVLTIDECEDRSHNCSDMATCTDALYQYKCTCHPGYSGDGFTCQDVDECTESNFSCGANEVCSNIPASYTCHCQQGYRKEGGTCQDIDECTEGNFSCGANEVCSNIPASYTCNNCQEGYRKEGDTCQDIDECTEGNFSCGANEVCSNIPASYTCNCQGYRKKGGTCQGLVCESPSLLMPDLGCLTIVQEQMNWDDAKSKCQQMGMRLAEDIKRKHIETISQHFYPLADYSFFWVGFRNGRWLTSGEEVKEEDWTEGHTKYNQICGSAFLNPPTVGLADYDCPDRDYVLCQSLP